MKITIQDVAEKADVSPSTVSRVFNNKGRISSETRESVLKVANKLGYQYQNKLSQNDKAKNIVIIFNNQLNNYIVNNPFYSQVMGGIEQSLRDSNYQLLFKTITGKIEQDLETIDDLINDKKTGGLILTGYEIDQEIIMKIEESDIPVVLIDNDLWTENINCVLNDNITGARKVVNHLIKLGHKDIAFIGGPTSHISLKERYLGYQQALQEAKIKVDEDLVRFCSPSFEISDGYQVAKELLTSIEDSPTAIFAANDKLAIGFLKACQELNYSVPEDISVAGFDDIEMAQHVMPALTTVRVFKREMGIEAGKRLIDLIDGIAPKPIKIVISVEVIIRNSTDVIK
ncbi:LacI family DNA-binding transcriptional regulator [Halanaerocella petrolearia]